MSIVEWCAGLGSALTSLLFLWWSTIENYAHPVFRVTSWVSNLVFYFSPYVQLTISEYGAERFQRSDLFLAVEAYLSATGAHRARKLKAADIARDSKNLQVYLDDNEEVIDTFRGVTLWWHPSKKKPNNRVISFYPAHDERRFYHLVFHRRHRDHVIFDYLPYVLNEGRSATILNRPRRLFTNKPSSRWRSYGTNAATWSHVEFQHPATFDTLAMDPDEKEAIIDDLMAFREAKDYYTKVGKAWKRGYLLYGPPGTGKSTMIAAMANFLDYDVYDLELTAVKNNTELRNLFIETKSKSIIIIEDIDCSVDLTGKRKDHKPNNEDHDNPVDPEMDEGTKMTLSGVLNFIDGLWSACGGERIIVFTTNNKDKLDPALIRPGRMDKHIEMSYCRFSAFKVLAKNFLDVEHHELFCEIQRLLEETDVSPADVAENLMPMSIKNRRNPDTCLAGLVEALKKKAKEVAEVKRTQESVDAAILGVTWEQVSEKMVNRSRTGHHDMTAMGPPSLVQADSEEWILDTRSLIHHTSNLQLLQEITTDDMQDVAQELSVLEHGSVRTRRFQVPDVGYIQGNARNVISVAQLARHGLEVVFEPNCAYVRNPATGKDIGMARLCDCVYVLDYLRISPPQAQDTIQKLPGHNGSRPRTAGSECRETTDNWFGMSPFHRGAKDPSLEVFLTSPPHESYRQTRTAPFYMDSGACNHMTWNGGVLRPYHADIQMEPPIQSVTRCDQSPPLTVGGIGYIDSKGGSLDRVLFVPDSKVNLISICQLTRDCFVRVVFHQDTFWIDRLESKERAGHGYQIGGNYVVAHLDVGAATDWVLDSLSWYHHTPNRQMMCDFQEKTSKDLPDSEGLQITGSVFTERFDILGVRCIVGDSRNVISVAQLAFDHALVTVFEPTRCHVKNKHTGKIVGKGLLRNGIYVLEYLRTEQQENVVGQEVGGGGGREAGDRDSGDGRGGSAGGGNEGQGINGEGRDSGRGGQANGGDGGRGGGDKDGKKEDQEGCGGGEEEEEEEKEEAEEEKEETEEENSSDQDKISFIIEKELNGRGQVEQKEELHESNKLDANIFGLPRFDRPTDPAVLLPHGAFPSSTNYLNDLFIVDTGACFHVTWNPSILFCYPEYLRGGIQQPITCFSGVAGSTADGHGSVQVTGYGYMDCDNIKLDGVLLAPTSQMNLLCVGQLGHQYGVTVEFGSTEVIFKGLDGSQVGRAYMNLENHHYVLDYFQPKFLYADLPTPHPNIFGKSCFGPRQQ